MNHGIIVGLEASRSFKQAELGSTKAMFNCLKFNFGLRPERLIAKTTYDADPLLGRRVDRKIAPLIPVFDQAGQFDGTWSRADFVLDVENDKYICPEGHAQKQLRRNYSDPNGGSAGEGTARFRALERVIQDCPSKARFCPI